MRSFLRTFSRTVLNRNRNPFPTAVPATSRCHRNSQLRRSSSADRSSGSEASLDSRRRSVSTPFPLSISRSGQFWSLETTASHILCHTHSRGLPLGKTVRESIHVCERTTHACSQHCIRCCCFHVRQHFPFHFFENPAEKRWRSRLPYSNRC